MDIDHIFIFTDTKDEVISDFVSFGLTANESRIHNGQGTSNTTFSFDNFFLEIVWVHNKEEIQSETVKPSGLWKRGEYSQNGFSPFGLIIVNDEKADDLFRNCSKYQPDYFPEGMAFDVIQNEENPHLPWTCRMPFKRAERAEVNLNRHKNKIQQLTKVIFEYTGNKGLDFTSQFKNEETILFKQSDKFWLTLIFDNNKQTKKQIFESLFLSIEY